MNIMLQRRQRNHCAYTLA
jgi:hypothetical protein